MPSKRQAHGPGTRFGCVSAPLLRGRRDTHSPLQMAEAYDCVMLRHGPRQFGACISQLFFVFFPPPRSNRRDTIMRTCCVHVPQKTAVSDPRSRGCARTTVGKGQAAGAAAAGTWSGRGGSLHARCRSSRSKPAKDWWRSASQASPSSDRGSATRRRGHPLGGRRRRRQDQQPRPAARGQPQ